MAPLDRALLSLDRASLDRVGPVLTWLRSRRGGPAVPEADLVHRFLTHELPERWGVDAREQHEVAWALGDLFAHAEEPGLAALCRSADTHETLAVHHWTRSFGTVPAAFWEQALASLVRRRPVPQRVTLSVASATGLLEVVAGGVPLTSSGELPAATVVALDDRFRWTEEFPWMRATDERGIPPLLFLREHLVAQELLVVEEGRLTRSRAGVAATGDPGRLWRALVDPSPRWAGEFERDALGVMAASVMRSADVTLGRVGEEMAQVLEGRWRPTGVVRRGSVVDGAATVARAWYQIGVPLGWWDTGRGPADRRPNRFGRAAAASVFRAVAGPVSRSRAPSVDPADSSRRPGR